MSVALERAAQEAAERRLAFCNAQMYEEEVTLDPTLIGEQPAGPFCGCDTCVVREVLDAAWPHIYELALDLARQEARAERPMEVANLAEQREHGLWTP